MILDDVWKPFFVLWIQRLFKNCKHICTVVFCLACLHYSTYWLCIINTKSMFSTKHRALFFVFFLMRAVVQTAQILFNQEQIQSRTLCACTDNWEPLFENTGFSSWWMEEGFPCFSGNSKCLVESQVFVPLLQLKNINVLYIRYNRFLLWFDIPRKAN